MRDLVVWLCRTPQRLATALVVVLVVVLLGGGLLFGGDGPGGGDGDEAAQQPAPTSAQLPDAGRFVSAAVSFARVWARPGPGETPAGWQQRLAPMVTDDLAVALRTTDLTTLPGTDVQGEPVVRFVAQSSALIAVSLADGSSVLVTVVDEGVGPRVSDVQPNLGDD